MSIFSKKSEVTTYTPAGEFADFHRNACDKAEARFNEVLLPHKEEIFTFVVASFDMPGLAIRVHDGEVMVYRNAIDKTIKIRVFDVNDEPMHELYDAVIRSIISKWFGSSFDGAVLHLN